MFDENFKKIIHKILEHEGGFVNNQSDPGGPTNYGISQRFLLDLQKQGNFPENIVIDKHYMQNLTVEQAKNIYHKEFWLQNKYHWIKNYIVAGKLLDMAVNIGPHQANLLTQRALNLLLNKNILALDGVMGTQTITVLNVIRSDLFLEQVVRLLKEYYHNLVKQKPSLKTFLNGWLNRATDV